MFLDRILKGFQSIPQRIADNFRKKPDRFLERLRQHALITLEASQALHDYMRHPNKKNAERIGKLEKNADEVRRIFIDELNRTFVVPIDRADLQTLSRAIDDVLDELWATVNEMDMLGVEPNIHLREMVELISTEIEEILLALERLPKHAGVATTHAIRARSGDNRLERQYAEALADLFKEPKDLDALVDIMKRREIYRHLFHASERVADVANLIEDVVVKFY